MADRLRIGTRGSALALAQSGMVALMIESTGRPAPELVTIRTSGDERNGVPAPVEGEDKARFVREIEQALLRGEIDLAVHSAKDLPAELPEGLGIVGVPAREDPRDYLCGTAESLEELPNGSRVGTASLRRRSQLLGARPDLRMRELRGNVDTRLRRLEEGRIEAIVLAAAGLKRLGREDQSGCLLDPEQMTPAAGQGILAIEARDDADAAIAVAAELTERDALLELTAERTVVRVIGADCDTPVGVSARVEGDSMTLTAYAGAIDGSERVRETLVGDAEQPVALGEALAERLDRAGAGSILARAKAEYAAQWDDAGASGGPGPGSGGQS